MLASRIAGSIWRGVGAVKLILKLLLSRCYFLSIDKNKKTNFRLYLLFISSLADTVNTIIKFIFPTLVEKSF
jgi:hypothetical protein